MKNINVTLKMVIAFLIMLILTVCICVVGILTANELNNATTLLYEESVAATETIGRIREVFQEQRSLAQELTLVKSDPAAVNRVITSISENKERMTGYISDYGNLLDKERIVPGREEAAQTKRDMLALYQNLYDDFFIVELDKVTKSAGNMNDAAIVAFITSEKADQMKDLMATAYDYYVTQARESAADANAIFVESRIFLVLIMIIATAISTIFLIYIPRTIARPLHHLVDVADAVSVGDMDMEIGDADRLDEVGRLAAAFMRMKDEINKQVAVVESLANADLTVEPKLRGDKDKLGKALIKLTRNLDRIISDVTTASEHVARESRQVAIQSQDLAQGTTEQAASVEQLSSAFFEISLNTKENANSAGKAAIVTDEVRQMALEGEELMAHLTQAVKDAATASKSIDKIIKVIEEISFQTNLLALNAAVEAAHAGQNGSGFAVVAAEVRSLASKSAASSKETSALIANALEKVQLGAEIAGKTSDSFKRIVSGIIESTRLISDIAKSSSEQAIAIEQINTGIGQVAQVIHTNSGAAEKCAAAANKMSGQSKALEDAVAQFRTKNAPRAQSAGADDLKAEAPKITIDLSPEIPSDGFGKY